MRTVNEMIRTATKATAFAAVAVKTSGTEKETNKCAPAAPICRPSELPVYTLPPKPSKSEHNKADSILHRNIEHGIRVVRCEMQNGIAAVTKQTETLHNYVDTAFAHTARTIDYLNEPQNTLPRGGAIAIGGLSGFIFAARGGFFKKVIYTSLGAGAIASICYPRQAEDHARLALHEGRKAFAVAYNFVKGVKPGDEMPVEPINKFPTTLEDVKFFVFDLYDDMKESFFPKKK